MILKSIKVHEIPEKIRFGSVALGEICIVMEPSINMDMEELLCKLGCELNEVNIYLNG